MKKIIGIISMVLVLAVVFMTSCKKETSAPVDQKQYVNAIAGSFIAKNGDVTLKSTPPVGSTVTWSMYAKNSPFYTPEVFDLVDGREFITGSVAYNFWSNAANNPVTFGATQAVYSNLTPDENLRLITETKDEDGNVAYLGMLDFKPSEANFPLTIHGFRLGDVLTINTDDITSLPGGDKMSISVAYNLAPVNLAATKIKPTLSGTNPGVPNGTEFGWGDIVYGTPVATSTIIGHGDVDVYDGLDKKVTGSIVITITDTYTGLVNDQPTRTITLPAITARGPGMGLKLILRTDKIGWYDSGIITFDNDDITVEVVYVDVD